MEMMSPVSDSERAVTEDCAAAELSTTFVSFILLEFCERGILICHL